MIDKTDKTRLMDLLLEMDAVMTTDITDVRMTDKTVEKNDEPNERPLSSTIRNDIAVVAGGFYSY